MIVTLAVGRNQFMLILEIANEIKYIQGMQTIMIYDYDASICIHFACPLLL